MPANLTPAQQLQRLKNLGNPVVTRNVSWLDLVTRAWGGEYRAPDKRMYEWSNGRTFDSTDQTNSGIYG